MSACFDDVSNELDPPAPCHIRTGPSFEQQAFRSACDRAWQALTRFRGGDLLDAAQEMEPFLSHPNLRNDSHRQAELETLLAVANIWRDDVDRALFFAHCALGHGSSARFHSVLLTVLRYGCWRGHQFSSFYGFSRARLHRQHPLMAMTQVAHLSMEAVTEVEQLRLKFGERLANEAIELADRLTANDSSVSLLATCVLASVAFEVGAIEEADLLCRGKAVAIEQHGTPDSALWGFTVMAKVALAKDVDNVGLWMLRKGQELGVQRGWARLVARCAAEEVALHLAKGKSHLAQEALDTAERRVASMGCSLSHSPHDWDLDLARHRIALAHGDGDSAVSGFTRLRDIAHRAGRMLWVVRFKLLLAASLFRMDKTEQAEEELRDALQMGVEGGLYRTLVDELPLIEPCLRSIRTSRQQRLGHLAPYIDSFLAVTSGSLLSRRKMAGQPRASEILSTKETIILRLISVGQSNKEIARELHIAPETVKSHAKRIFIKLSTKTRAEAVARGAEMGIL